MKPFKKRLLCLTSLLLVGGQSASDPLWGSGWAAGADSHLGPMTDVNTPVQALKQEPFMISNM